MTKPLCLAVLMTLGISTSNAEIFTRTTMDAKDLISYQGTYLSFTCFSRVERSTKDSGSSTGLTKLNAQGPHKAAISMDDFIFSGEERFDDLSQKNGMPIQLTVKRGEATASEPMGAYRGSSQTATLEFEKSGSGEKLKATLNCWVP